METDVSSIDRHANGQKARNPAIDHCRGIAIVCVVLIHTTGHFLRRLEIGSPAWALLAILNGTLQFAVPAFLLITTYLVSNRLYDLAPAKRIVAAWRRIPRVFWIYVGISVLYLADGARNNRAVLSPAHLQSALLWGKASFHLYYLVILLQLLVLLPVGTLIVRREWTISRLVAGASLLQALVYIWNRWVIPAPYPGTLLGWYLVPVALGLWMASRGNDASFSRTTTGRLFWVTVLSSMAFLPLAAQSLAGQAVDSVLYQAASWTYTSAAALLIYAWSQRITGPAVSSWLTLLGRTSLSIYLFHPLVIELLDHLTRRGAVQHATVTWMPIYVSACVAIPIAASKIGAAVTSAIGRRRPRPRLENTTTRLRGLKTRKLLSRSTGDVATTVPKAAQAGGRPFQPRR